MTGERSPLEVQQRLLAGLSDEATAVVQSPLRRLLVIAGAGAGKTEAMARRIAWWHAIDGVAKDQIVAFTFTERAAEEMKFRVRKYMSAVSPNGEDPSLGGMYVGTIHSYCLNTLRRLWPRQFHNDEILDEVARYSLVQQGYDFVLGLPALQKALGAGRQYGKSRADTIDFFLRGYDLLNEYNRLDVRLPESPMPAFGYESEWCKEAELSEPVGDDDIAEAFSKSAARYHAFLRCRHFLDFSSSQSELVRRLQQEPEKLEELRAGTSHLVIDEVQDVNKVQDDLRRLILGDQGHLTAVGDHRQAIYGFRGGRIDLMADLADELEAGPDSGVLEMTANYRSTPRIVELSNRWNDTIGAPGTMSAADMTAGREGRADRDDTHVMTASFVDREAEATWIADAISELVRGDQGAEHDAHGGDRGICYSDIGVLVRSSTDARTYQNVLRERGIPAVVRAGPDLFAQPEVLLFASALHIATGRDSFPTSNWNERTIGNRVRNELDGAGDAVEAIPAALKRLEDEGLLVEPEACERLLRAARAMATRLVDEAEVAPSVLEQIQTPELREFLKGSKSIRRVFPQSIYQWLLAETGMSWWDDGSVRGRMATFHLGQLSSLLTGIETPGWTSPKGFVHQIFGLLLWASKQASPDEAPLLVAPDAVTVTTIHSVKGLEYGAVFVADVAAYRFPSNMAKRGPELPYGDELRGELRTDLLADNANTDSERRLMYVALTRAERYLFVTTSRKSSFFKKLEDLVEDVGGVASDGEMTPVVCRQASVVSNETRLMTSFSDLRYYLECPHDFYLRKVLGFSPTIDQAFGYGRGVHNLMREVHLEPAEWAALRDDREALEARIQELIDQGLFYLRHTTGTPAALMHAKGVRIVADYVETYGDELAQLEFEPEREFEVLLPEENVLVTGAIDVVRCDSPPRVSIVDFKSGEAVSDKHQGLDEDEMRLQVSIYAIAAKQELQYEPELGLVRYLGEPDRSKAELRVPLDDEVVATSRRRVASLASSIQNRKFDEGPSAPEKEDKVARCQSCDFKRLCSHALC